MELRFEWVTAVLVFLTSGCVPDGEERVKLGQNEYAIPASRVQSKVLLHEGMPYLNIDAPHRWLHVIYAARNKFSTNYTGTDTPLITHVDDIPSKFFFAVIQFKGGKTVCNMEKVGLQCGLSVDNRGTQWSVIFDSFLLEQSDTIRSEVTRMLEGYRRQGEKAV